MTAGSTQESPKSWNPEKSNLFTSHLHDLGPLISVIFFWSNFMQHLDAFRCTCIHNKNQQHLQIKTLPYPTWYPHVNIPMFFRPFRPPNFSRKWAPNNGTGWLNLPVVSMGPNLITTDFRPDPPTTKGGTISIVPKIDQNCHLKETILTNMFCEHIVKKHIMVKKL